jgi:ATP/ADP translocase/HEAT repeat protein
MAVPGWQRGLLELLALKPGQGVRTLLTAFYLYLVVAAYLMLKSASKSLFLERLGAVKLPYVTIIIAIVVTVFVALYIRVARRVKPTALVTGTLLVFVSNLIIFWWLDRIRWGWVYPVLYIWVGMYGIIATTQVWTLANDLFTTREAKRVFGVIGSGGIVGAISGGILTGALAQRIGTPNLLLAAAGLLLLAAGVVVLDSRYRLPTHARSEDEPPPRQLLDSLRLVANSPHLRLIAGLVLITALATKMVDWQFNAVAEIAFDDQDSRTAFFGKFDAATGLIGFLIQFLLTSRLLMLFGLGGTMLIFPVTMLLGTVFLIPTMSLWAAMVAKGSDQTLKHSIDRSSRELVYLPVRRSIKIQAKSAIDMVIDRSGDGLAGFVQLGLIALLTAQGSSQLEMVRLMAVVTLLFIGLWLFIALRLRKSYVAELGHSIGERKIQVGSWHESLGGAETLTAVRKALVSDHEPTALAALELVGDNPNWELGPTLSNLAKQGTPEVRARALAILLDPDNPELPDGVADAFQREDQTLLAELIDLQLAVDPHERRRRAQAVLDRAGGPARGAWVALMVRRLGPEFQPVARGLLEELIKPESAATVREVAATAIGLLPAASRTDDMLIPLLSDDDPKVASAAARSIGAIGNEAQLRALVPLLARTPTRRAARLALQRRGEPAVAVLFQSATDESIERRARLKIPAVLAGIESSEALSALAHLLVTDDRLMVQATSETLYRLRLKKPDLSMVPSEDVRALILTQAKKCSRLVGRIAALATDPPAARSPAWELLSDSLRAAHERHHLGVYQTLCLCYSPRQIVSCRRSLLDGNLELRANAAELLDNLVPRKLWRELLPILYREGFEKMGAAAARSVSSSEKALIEIASGEDRWLRACAVQLIDERGLAAIADEGERRIETVDSMTVVEKVMALRGVALFAGTPPEHLSLVAAVARDDVFPVGSVISEQNAPPGDTYVLLGGKVVVEQDGLPLGELGVGETIGTWALFEDEPSQVTTRVIEEAPVLRIDRFGFEEVLDEHPELSRSLIQQLIRRMRKLAG